MWYTYPKQRVFKRSWMFYASIKLAWDSRMNKKCILNEVGIIEGSNGPCSSQQEILKPGNNEIRQCPNTGISMYTYISIK